MVKLTRGGVTTDVGESLSEFKARQQKERIERRGLTKREKKRQETAEKEMQKISL